jgi:hypothetical protein
MQFTNTDTRNPPSRSSNSRRLAIIAILAAILFRLGRARENARRSSCQSNLKQIGLGILQYSQDYDEKMPFTGDDGGGRFPGTSMSSPTSRACSCSSAYQYFNVNVTNTGIRWNDDSSLLRG